MSAINLGMGLIPDWSEVECKGDESDLWFSVDYDGRVLAASICGMDPHGRPLTPACPRREECFRGAIERGESAGIWGGRLLIAGKPVKIRRPNKKGAASCGTDSGYRRHLKRDEDACDDCLRAHRNAAVGLRPGSLEELDAEHGEEIKRRYLAGELVQGIAEDYGIRKGSLIRDALGAAGVPLRDDSGRHPHPISRGRIDLDRARVEELRARGLSLERITDELGVKVGVVKKRRQEWARADAAKAGKREEVA